MTIQLNLEPAQYAALSQRAEAEALSVEEYILGQLFAENQRAEVIQAATDYLLKKNAELYRRLAQ